jgi:hypothetical protein
VSMEENHSSARKHGPLKIIQKSLRSNLQGHGVKNIPELLVPGWAGRLSTGRGQQQGRHTALLAREAYTP